MTRLSLTIAAIVLAAFFFWRTLQPGTPPLLMVLPGDHQAIESGNRGGDELVEFELRNISAWPCSIVVEHKTCKCLSVEVDRKTLRPQEISTLRLRIGVPVSGRTTGAVSVRAVSLNDNATEQLLGLSYVLTGVQKRGLLVAPAKLHLGGALSSSAFPISCSVFGIGRPSAVCFKADKATLVFRALRDWSPIAHDRYAAVFEVLIPQACEANALVVLVDAESASSKQEIRLAH